MWNRPFLDDIGQNKSFTPGVYNEPVVFDKKRIKDNNYFVNIKDKGMYVFV